MATIRKHRDKYQVQIRRKGFAPINRTFHLLSDAKEWARDQERRIDRRELGPDWKVLEAISLADLVTRYRDTILPDKRSGLVETIMLTAFLRHSICRKRLSDLTAADFSKWKDDKLAGADGRPGITLKSAKRLLSPIQHMFEIAMTDWEIPLRENPLARFRLKVADNKRQRRVRDGELDRLLEAGMRTQNPLVMSIVHFALETAMRRGEILSMLWDHIDLERRSLIIPVGKNGHSRIIPLTTRAVEILTGLDRNEPQVFPTSPIALRLAWTRLVRRAGIADLHFHDLRHEAISRFFEKGLTVPEVASISGHRDIRMLMRYAHADRDRVLRKLG